MRGEAKMGEKVKGHWAPVLLETEPLLITQEKKWTVQYHANQIPVFFQQVVTVGVGR